MLLWGESLPELQSHGGGLRAVFGAIREAVADGALEHSLVAPGQRPALQLCNQETVACTGFAPGWGQRDLLSIGRQFQHRLREASQTWVNCSGVSRSSGGNTLACGLSRQSGLPDRCQAGNRREVRRYSTPSRQLIAPPTSTQTSSHKRSRLRFRARIRSTASRSAGG